MKLFRNKFLFAKFLILVITLFTVNLLKLEEATKLNLAAATEEEYENSMQQRDMTEEEKKKFDSIRKPDAPSEIPQDVRFMQKELSRAYSEAKKEYNPRFMEAEAMNKKFMSLFPKDKRAVGVPVNRAG